MSAEHPAALPPLDLGDPQVLQLTRRLFWRRGFAHRLIAAGWDPDDALQEIYLGLLTRQAGDSAYDSARAGLSKYLYMVISSVTLHLLDRRQTREARRQVSVEDMAPGRGQRVLSTDPGDDDGGGWLGGWLDGGGDHTAEAQLVDILDDPAKVLEDPEDHPRDPRQAQLVKRPKLTLAEVRAILRQRAAEPVRPAPRPRPPPTGAPAPVRHQAQLFG